MQDSVPESALAQQVWFVMERTDSYVGDPLWKPCCKVVVQTANPMEEALRKLALHPDFNLIRYRLKAFLNEQCEGDPIVEISSSDLSTSPPPVTTDDVPVPPDAEQANPTPDNVLPFPTSAAEDGPTSTAEKAGADQSDDASDPLAALAAEPLKTRDPRPGFASRIYTPTNKESSELLAIVREKAHQHAKQLAEEALLQWAQALESAIQQASEATAKEIEDGNWMDTATGVTLVAHAASGFVASFIGWSVYK